MQKVSIKYNTNTEKTFSDIINESLERVAGMNGGYKVGEGLGKDGASATFAFDYHSDVEPFLQQLRNVVPRLKLAFPLLTMSAIVPKEEEVI